MANHMISLISLKFINGPQYIFALQRATNCHS